MRKGGVQKYISLMRYVNPPPSKQNLILHPLIHTFGPSILAPKYCSLVSRAKVWIKVCNAKYQQKKQESLDIDYSN